MMLTINLVKTTNYDAPHLEKLKTSLIMMQEVLNSVQFKEAVLNYRTDGELSFSFRKNVFTNFDHYTNKEVYNLIMQAAEQPGNITNRSVDLHLILLPGGGGTTVGYGHPGDETIYTFSDWFDLPTTTSKDIANHITHEWCHKIGFDHSRYEWQDKFRERSVPYGVGDLVESFFGMPNLVPNTD